MIPKRASAQHVRAFTTVVACQKSTAERLSVCTHSQLSCQVWPVRVRKSRWHMPAAQYIAKTGPIFKGADSLSLTFSWSRSAFSLYPTKNCWISPIQTQLEMSLIGDYHSTDGLRLLTSWRTVAAASRVVVDVVVVAGLPSNSIASWSTPVWRVRSRACAITSAVQRTCLQVSFTVDCSCSRCSTRVFAAVSSSAVNACHSSRIAAFQYQRVLSPEPHGSIGRR